MKKIMITAILALSLAGCATKYGEMGLLGGVQAQQITSDTYRIIARGNGYTNSTTVKDFSLLKAAETTLSVGKRYFVVLEKQDTTGVEYNTTYNRYVGATTSAITKPAEDLTIKILPANVAGAYDAKEISKYVGDRIKPKEETPQVVEKPKT